MPSSNTNPIIASTEASGDGFVDPLFQMFPNGLDSELVDWKLVDSELLDSKDMNSQEFGPPEVGWIDPNVGKRKVGFNGSGDPVPDYISWALLPSSAVLPATFANTDAADTGNGGKKQRLKSPPNSAGVDIGSFVPGMTFTTGVVPTNTDNGVVRSQLAHPLHSVNNEKGLELSNDKVQNSPPAVANTPPGFKTPRQDAKCPPTTAAEVTPETELGSPLNVGNALEGFSLGPPMESKPNNIAVSNETGTVVNYTGNTVATIIVGRENAAEAPSSRRRHPCVSLPNQPREVIGKKEVTRKDVLCGDGTESRQHSLPEGGSNGEDAPIKHLHEKLCGEHTRPQLQEHLPSHLFPVSQKNEYTRQNENISMEFETNKIVKDQYQIVASPGEDNKVASNKNDDIASFPPSLPHALSKNELQRIQMDLEEVAQTQNTVAQWPSPARYERDDEFAENENAFPAADDYHKTIQANEINNVVLEDIESYQHEGIQMIDHDHVDPLQNDDVPAIVQGNELQEPNQGAIDAAALANDNVNDEPQENEAGNMDPEELQEPNQFVDTELLQSLPQSLRNAVIALPPQVTPATTPSEFAMIVLQMHIANDRFPLPDFQAGGSPANRFAQPGEEVPVPEANIRPKDFLCGRMTTNTGADNHAGNRYRKHLVDSFLVLYCIYDARHAMKSRLSRWIVTEATTGRFLEKVNDGMFRLMTFEQAWKTGVGQQFRDELRRRKRNEAGA